MSNPVLIVQHAGYGTTPAWDGATYQPGDVVTLRNLRALAGWPTEMVVIGHVPPGVPAEHALADLVGRPRPLMVTKERRYGRYILVEEDGSTPYLASDKHIKSGRKAAFEIGTVSAEGSQ